MDTFTNAYDEKIRPLMDKIDQVRSILSINEDGINFPNVVVVGDQSSGKSTLLEALSLVDLPKGSGIVTRCPLVLRLRKADRRRVYRMGEKNVKNQLNEKKLNILSYIEEETRKLAGDNKNVVHDMIELLVEDPHVRDLTVVDLPGIARNPIANQPKDIHQQTTNLIRKFIGQEGSVILCVFPGNVDVATVESFTIAREVDPEGVRTIGVITKTDLAPNQDALIQQLMMEKADVLHLKLGFVAVRNRSTDENISLEDARRREKDYFRDSSILEKTGWHCLGIEALIHRLADLYSDRVRETFPKMRKDVNNRLREVCEQLAKLPPNLETSAARLMKYHELADYYVDKIIRGRFANIGDGEHHSVVNELHAKFKKFENIIHRQSYEFQTDPYRSKVKKAMAACFGEQLPNFLPHPVLKRLIDEKLEQLWEITQVLIKECFLMPLGIISDKEPEARERDILFSRLLPLFRQVAERFLHRKETIVYEHLKELIRVEKQDPYTLNHYYMEAINDFRDYFRRLKSSDAEKSNYYQRIDPDLTRVFQSVSNEEQSVQDMIISIFAYWKILVQRFIDYATLSLRAGCVFDICDGIKQDLRELPMKQTDVVDVYLAEDAVVRNKRKQLQQTKERLEKVDAILGGSGVFEDGLSRAGGSSLGASSTVTLDSIMAGLPNFEMDAEPAPTVKAPPKATQMQPTVVTANPSLVTKK